jgi:hypothetical protein
MIPASGWAVIAITALVGVMAVARLAVDLVGRVP